MEVEKQKRLFLVDSHAHLDELDDLSESLRDARAAGVKGIIGVGVDVESNEKILQIARENPEFVYPALGYHPWQIMEEEVEVEKNLSFIRDHVHECVALGEIGLDYKVRIKKDLQWKVFGKLLEFACEFDKPVIIHCRFSHRRALEMVIERAIRRAVFHWYSGPLDVLEKILSTNCFISATPALRYSPYHQEAVRKAPLERILLETDTPVNYQGLEARPKDVRISLEEVGRIKGFDLLTVSKQTTVNASKVFQIPF